jgi:uncharacterized membrane protein YhaH (DUF805 family)
MGFDDAIKSGFRNTFRYSGRAGRSEFWYFALFLLLGNIATMSVGLELLFAINDGTGVWIALSFFYVALVPFFAVGVRRLHDINMRGWWLIGLFPVYYLGSARLPVELLAGMVDILDVVIPFYLLVVVFCLARPGTRGDNRFGRSLDTPVTSPPIPE